MYVYACECDDKGKVTLLKYVNSNRNNIIPKFKRVCYKRVFNSFSR